jgi:hypothetical protein
MERLTLTGGFLALCLLAAPMVTLADHHHDMDHHDGSDDTRHHDMDHRDMDHHDTNHHGDASDNHHGKDRRYDPVQRAEKHLKLLEQALELTADQRGAWSDYSDAVMAQAQNKADRMEQWRARRGEMRDLDTASKLEKMSEWMSERADRLAQMARDTRRFQQALTAEQQASFDQFWRKHSRHRKGRRH